MVRHVVTWSIGIVVCGNPLDDLTGSAYAGEPPEAQTVVPLSESFEDTYRFRTLCNAGCTPSWTTVTTDAHTGTHSFFGTDVDTASDKSLISSNGFVIPINASAATLTFWHHFEFETSAPDSFFDGGVLEVSTDGGQIWEDAGPDITSGRYNGTIADLPTGNALGGRAGWVGALVDWQQVSVDLMLYRNQSFTFRLRMGTDESNFNAAVGWWVDDIQVSYAAPLTSCSRSWSAPRPYPIGVDQPAAAGLDGTLYVFGGMTDTGATANAYSYSPQSNEWTPIASLPEARAGAAAVSDGTSIYIFGGENDQQLQKTLWRYDPAANSYATLAPLNSVVAYQAAAFVAGSRGSTIYSIGGTSDDGQRQFHTRTVEIYSVPSNEWANSVPEHPEPLARLAAVGLGGFVYTAGGSNEAGESLKTYRYDPDSRVWEDQQIADLPSPGVTTGALYKGTWLLEADGAAIGWDPAANRWRSFDQIPKLVFDRAAVAGDAFFLVGGGERMMASRAVQQYVETDCASATPTVTPPIVATPTSITGTGCVGDCGGDRMVAVSELVRGVSIALGAQPLAMCPSFDRDRNGSVGVNELVAAVNNALRGCS
jgi:hypothetical protein